MTRTRPPSVPPGTVIDDHMRLRQELKDKLSASVDKRLEACYGLLLAIFDRRRERDRNEERGQTLAGIRQLMESVGEGPDQVIDVSQLWQAVPPELAGRNEDTSTDLMERFVVLVSVPNTRRRTRLEAEIRWCVRLIQNSQGEPRKQAYPRVWSKLLTKL